MTWTHLAWKRDCVIGYFLFVFIDSHYTNIQQIWFKIQLYSLKHPIKVQRWELHGSSSFSVITTVRSPTCTHWSCIDLCMRNSGLDQFSILTLHFHSIFWLKGSNWTVKNWPTQIETERDKESKKIRGRVQLPVRRSNNNNLGRIIPQLYHTECVYLRFAIMRRGAALYTSIIHEDLPLHSLFSLVVRHVKYA